MLERNVRNTVFRFPGIEKPCDVRMIEPSQDLALGTEAGVVDLGVESRSEELERDTLCDLQVGAFSEEYARHAAASQLVHNPVRTDASPDERHRRSGVACFINQRRCRRSRG